MRRWVLALFVLLLVNTAYLALFASPTVFYMSNVLVHIVLGVLLMAAAAWLIRRDGDLRARLGRAAPMLLGASFAFGLLLLVIDNTRNNSWALIAHIGLGVAGVLWVTSVLWRNSRWPRAVVAASVVVIVGFHLIQRSDEGAATITNPPETPLTMEEEGGGPESPFWPASAKTSTGDFIPTEFFLSSEKCGECHKDIYEQWNSSAHHFASFNNQFYRKSIEHMQEVSGDTQSSKWCAGCHDHAVLFAGKWEEPIAGQIDTPAAQAGLGCLSCHAIVHVDGTMGNSGFTLEYLDVHEFAVSENPAINFLSDFLTRRDPEPHRRAFLKPFMKTSEFCSACHKVHLDKPVNNYRWIRGFNSYDNWQASGVSGEGARSFYYPEKPLQCGGCHMPLVEGEDPAAKNGMVHNHRFPAANTALPHVNKDEKQMEVTKAFLESGFITVDIFAAAPVQDEGLQMVRRSDQGQELMSTFAVGEEAQHSGQITIREVGDVTAPLDCTDPEFRPGDTLRVDVVVRTRTIGHFFPTGTVDSFDVWLELKGEDATGQPIFWSGSVEEDGEIDAGSHFYKSYMLDGAGNPVDKRNAWQTRSLLYARLIPPGAADAVHYRVKIPEDAKGPVKLTARLLHRKFTHFYTKFSYAGQPAEGKPDINHESRTWSFNEADIPDNVAGKIRDRIPELPITELARDEVSLQLGDTETEWTQMIRGEDWSRWNDWGIGMLLQGDLKGAEYAFRKATEADPKNPDGWLNVARALIQEGEIEKARPFLAKAKELGPDLARVHFFEAMAFKADGNYEEALKSLEFVHRQYPRDRVALNQMGTIRFRMRDYEEAVDALRKVTAIDPEDLQAHYTLMLAYRGLGDKEAAAREQQLFLRFKADESSQRLTARQRRLSPEDNNERQTIHDHTSGPLAP